jgi:hypothetical protein
MIGAMSARAEQMQARASEGQTVDAHRRHLRVTEHVLPWRCKPMKRLWSGLIGTVLVAKAAVKDASMPNR